MTSTSCASLESSLISGLSPTKYLPFGSNPKRKMAVLTIIMKYFPQIMGLCAFLLLTFFLLNFSLKLFLLKETKKAKIMPRQ